MYLSHTHKSNFHRTLAFNTINAKLHASSNLENTSTVGLTTQEPIHSPIKVCPPTIQSFLGAGPIVGQL